MNENKDLAGLPKDIPHTQSGFQLDILGNLTQKRYLGDFTCKIPTVKEQCLIDKHQVLLNGEMPHNLKPATLKIHEMIAYLRYTLIDYPKFWKDSDLGYELRDPNVVQAIYDKVIDFENKWLKEIWGDLTQTDTEEEDDGQES